MILFRLLFVSIFLISPVVAMLDYPLKCTWWTWGEWDRRDCLPLGHPACAKEKRKEFRYRQIQWRPKYGQKPCYGKYVDFRPCICLSPEAVEFVTPPPTEHAFLAAIGEFIEKILYELGLIAHQ